MEAAFRRASAVALVFLALGLATRGYPQGRVVRGRVVDFQGAPVAGATVVLTDRPTEGIPWGTTTTDAQGAFEIRTREHARYVQVTHADFPPTLENVPFDALVRVTLRHAFRVQGVALKRHGTPFAGAQVLVRSSGSGGEQLSPRAVTAGDGSFAVDGVPPGLLEVQLFDRTGRILVDATHVLPSAVPQSGLVKVKFTRRPVHVRGRVRWSGLPLPDALVYPGDGEVPERRPTLWPADSRGMPNPARAITLTSQDGRFEMFLPPGLVSLAVEHGDRTHDFGRHALEVPDEEECSLEVDLAPVLSGVVVDKDSGQRIPGAAIHVRLESGAPARGPRAWWQVAGADGSFSFNLDPGDYTLRHRLNDYVPVEVALAVGSEPHPDLRLELTRALAIAGRVVLPAHVTQNDVYGNPWILRARSADGRHTQEAFLDHEGGGFSLSGLRPVPYSVCAGTPEWGWAVMVGVEPGTDDLTLVIQPPGHLDLVFKDSAGRPVEGAFATVASLSKAPIVLPGQTREVSDATGRLRLAVPAGALELSVFSQDYRQLLEVEVGPGATAHLEVELSAPREPR